MRFDIWQGRMSQAFEYATDVLIPETLLAFWLVVGRLLPTPLLQKKGIRFDTKFGSI